MKWKIAYTDEVDGEDYERFIEVEEVPDSFRFNVGDTFYLNIDGVSEVVVVDSVFIGINYYSGRYWASGTAFAHVHIQED